ncbi:MAG: putative membrane protein [Candidatus Promineifilaceae bacterium]|jgi:uncharacterized membrane protein
MNHKTCPICNEQRPADHFHPGKTVPPPLVSILKQKNPAWHTDGMLCEFCIQESRAGFFADTLAMDDKELSSIEQDVLNGFVKQVLVPLNENETFEKEMSWSEELAGTVAEAVGSWYFPAGIAIFLLGWAILNLQLVRFDPYPMVWIGGTSAVLASLSALHGPFIMMSQRSANRRDSVRAQNDYQVNLRAELQIEYLTRQIQHLLDRQEAMMATLESMGGSVDNS